MHDGVMRPPISSGHARHILISGLYAAHYLILLSAALDIPVCAQPGPRSDPPTSQQIEQEGWDLIAKPRRYIPKDIKGLGQLTGDIHYHASWEADLKKLVPMNGIATIEYLGNAQYRIFWYVAQRGALIEDLPQRNTSPILEGYYSDFEFSGRTFRGIPLPKKAETLERDTTFKFPKTKPELPIPVLSLMAVLSVGLFGRRLVPKQAQLPLTVSNIVLVRTRF